MIFRLHLSREGKTAPNSSRALAAAVHGHRPGKGSPTRLSEKEEKDRGVLDKTWRNHPLPQKVSAVHAKIPIPILGLDSSQPWIRKRAWKWAGSKAVVLRKYCFYRRNNMERWAPWQCGQWKERKQRRKLHILQRQEKWPTSQSRTSTYWTEWTLLNR